MVGPSAPACADSPAATFSLGRLGRFAVCTIAGAALAGVVGSTPAAASVLRAPSAESSPVTYSATVLRAGAPAPEPLVPTPAANPSAAAAPTDAQATAQAIGSSDTTLVSAVSTGRTGSLPTDGGLEFRPTGQGGNQTVRLSIPTIVSSGSNGIPATVRSGVTYRLSLPVLATEPTGGGTVDVRVDALRVPGCSGVSAAPGVVTRLECGVRFAASTNRNAAVVVTVRTAGGETRVFTYRHAVSGGVNRVDPAI